MIPENVPTIPTRAVVIELAVRVDERIDPNLAAAALFDLISAVPCPWPEGSDPPGIVSYDGWEVRVVEPAMATGIGLACGHAWEGEGTVEHAELMLTMCQATGDTAMCHECGTQQAVTGPVITAAAGG